MNKEIAHYVVTAHPPGGVLLTAKCNFLSEHSTVCVCLFVCLFVGVTVNELASAFAGLFALLSLKDKTVSVVGGVSERDLSGGGGAILVFPEACLFVEFDVFVSGLIR